MILMSITDMGLAAVKLPTYRGVQETIFLSSSISPLDFSPNLPKQYYSNWVRYLNLDDRSGSKGAFSVQRSVLFSSGKLGHCHKDWSSVAIQ
jgi:hypothetical protein